MTTILPVGSPVDIPLHIGDHLVPDTSMLSDNPPEPLHATPTPTSTSTSTSTPTPGAWVERMRHTVTGHPLAALAAAFVLGTVVARARR